MKTYCEKHDMPYEMVSTAMRCKKCHAEYQKAYRKRRANDPFPSQTAARQRAYMDKHSYGLSHEESTELRSRGKCDACGVTEGDATMVIDHDHETGRVRGLLCRHCNLALGHVKDNPQLLRTLADYLESD